mgnify:CR=1 FL=1
MFDYFSNAYSCFFGILISLVSLSCSNNPATEKIQETTKYLNHADSVKYLGKETCRNCHFDKYETFSHTGMGKSFSTANQNHSAARFHKDSILFDSELDLYYRPYWKDSILVLAEYRLAKNGDTVHKRIQQIDFIVGSGQHTNSHMVNSNGYITQAPFTYYTQDGKLDFPPGFEDGKNSRFSRQIGLECMSCHNALPDIVMGSANKFEKVHNGIDCERCHGPGELHVEKVMRGELTDTAIHTDYTIVNPSKLTAELQFDLCSRCHLQGNTVLKEGKDFFDFKPGMKLSDVMNTFLPKYSNSEDEFIMASHVDRLKMSTCFLSSDKELTCLTCHDPHISVQVTPKEKFQKTCESCHQEKQCTEPVEKWGEMTCTECHMPKSGSIDIPHVRITDHKIAVPRGLDKEETEDLKKFLKLYCVNDENPDKKTLIRAYLQQYERFEQEPKLLSDVVVMLRNAGQSIEYIHEWLHYYYLIQDYSSMVALLQKLEEPKVFEALNKSSYENVDAWSAYRLAVAQKHVKNKVLARKYYEKAIKLAPFMLDFQLEYADDLIRWNQFKKAIPLLESVLKENPLFEKAYTLLGYSYARIGEFAKAEIMYDKAIVLNANDLQAKTNLAGLYFMKGMKDRSIELLEEVLKRDPKLSLAERMLEEINKQ